MEDNGNVVETVGFRIQTNRETEMFYEDAVEDGKRRFPLLKSLCIENKNEFVVENVCVVLNSTRLFGGNPDMSTARVATTNSTARVDTTGRKGFDLYPKEKISASNHPILF